MGTYTEGTYTELIFGAELKKSTPNSVITTLKYMVGDLDTPTGPIVFDYQCNPLIGGSYYFGVHHGEAKMEYDEASNSWTISTRTNIKNTWNDIENFLAWIKPYIEFGSGARDMYAVVMYEESEEPVMHYKYEADGEIKEGL